MSLRALSSKDLPVLSLADVVVGPVEELMSPRNSMVKDRPEASLEGVVVGRVEVTR